VGFESRTAEKLDTSLTHLGELGKFCK